MAQVHPHYFQSDEYTILETPELTELTEAQGRTIRDFQESLKSSPFVKIDTYKVQAEESDIHPGFSILKFKSTSLSFSFCRARLGVYAVVCWDDSFSGKKERKQLKAKTKGSKPNASVASGDLVHVRWLICDPDNQEPPQSRHSEKYFLTEPHALVMSGRQQILQNTTSQNYLNQFTVGISLQGSDGEAVPSTVSLSPIKVCRIYSMQDDHRSYRPEIFFLADTRVVPHPVITITERDFSFEIKEDQPERTIDTFVSQYSNNE